MTEAIENEINNYNIKLNEFRNELNDEHITENDCVRSFNETMALYREILRLNQALRKQIRDKIDSNNARILELRNRSTQQLDTNMPWPGRCLPWDHDWRGHCKYHLGDDWEPGLRPDGSTRRSKGGCGGWPNCNSTFDQQYDGECPPDGFWSLTNQNCRLNSCTDGLWLMVCNNTHQSEINNLVNENTRLTSQLNGIVDPESPKAICNVCNNRIEVRVPADLANISQSCIQQQNIPPPPTIPPSISPIPPSIIPPIFPTIPPSLIPPLMPLPSVGNSMYLFIIIIIVLICLSLSAGIGLYVYNQ